MVHQNPVANTLKEMLAINNDPNWPGAFDIVRVQLNDESSLMGFVTRFYEAEHPNGFQFQRGIPMELGAAISLTFTLAPQLQSDGSSPVWLYFGEKPTDVHHVVCSRWARNAIEERLGHELVAD